MAKKTTNTKPVATPAKRTAEPVPKPVPAVPTISVKAEPITIDRATAKAVRTPKTVTAPKRTAKKSDAPVSVSAAPAPAPRFTTDEIALRAYFIAENRQRLGLSGDPLNDWVEAERSLLQEAQVTKPKRKKATSG